MIWYSNDAKQNALACWNAGGTWAEATACLGSSFGPGETSSCVRKFACVRADHLWIGTRKYGVSWETVRKAALGRTWAHVC